MGCDWHTNTRTYFFMKGSVARVFSFCRSARCENAGLYNDASFTVIFHDGKGSEAMLLNNRLVDLL
jgi:hypothetical protein